MRTREESLKVRTVIKINFLIILNNIPFHIYFDKLRLPFLSRD